MAKYYMLASGLPNLSLEAQKLSLTRAEYLEELDSALSRGDKALLQTLRGEEWMPTLLQWLSSGALSPEGQEADELEELPELNMEDLDPDDVEAIREAKCQHALRGVARLALLGRSQAEAVRHARGLAPSYMARFVWRQFAPKGEEEAEEPSEGGRRAELSLADQLSQLYFEEARKSGNRFVDGWMTFVQTLRNVLVVHTCRKLGWDPAGYVVGGGAVVEQLLSSRSRDFDLKDEVPFIDSMVQIAEEGDITRRERMIDALKWRWLEEATFARTFDVDYLLAYYLQLSVVERWLRLDAETGERVFREIVMGLKSESNRSLQAFKEETRKR